MKFGIIGTNFVSDYFMKGANQHDLCEVVAVSATSMTKANAFADKYDIEHRFDNYQQMCNSSLCDAVYVAVPNSMHYEVSMYFLKNKVAVYCEKPLASNITQVIEMINCAKANNTYLHEGLLPLFNPNFKILKDNLHLVGKIHQASFNFSKYSSRYDAYLRNENPTTFRSELANGALMDLGVYVFATVIGLWSNPLSLSSNCTLLDTKADISGISVLNYPGFSASLSYSKASDTQNVNEICGENGIITIDFVNRPTLIKFTHRLSQKETTLSVPIKDQFYYVIDDMIKSIEKGNIQSSLHGFDSTLNVHTTITNARKKANIVYDIDE